MQVLQLWKNDLKKKLQNTNNHTYTCCSGELKEIFNFIDNLNQTEYEYLEKIISLRCVEAEDYGFKDGYTQALEKHNF